METTELKTEAKKKIHELLDCCDIVDGKIECNCHNVQEADKIEKLFAQGIVVKVDTIRK